MSSRALRKLQGNNDLDFLENSLNNDVDNEYASEKSRCKEKKAVNPFDLLNNQEEVEEEEEKIEGDEKEEKQITPVTLGGVELGENGYMLPFAEIKKKRKKRKKKGKGKPEVDDVKQEENEDEIDASIREINEMLGAAQVSVGPVSEGESTSFTMDTKALLRIEHRHLNAENEMRKRFGSDVVRSESTPRQRRGHRRVYHRSSWLVSPKQTWPHMGKSGITMKLLENKKGYYYFTFEHSTNYQNVQFQFLDAVESLDPNNISAILRVHPYHIDALLQLSEICKIGEDYQMAAELIERALYCCECSFHTLFSLTQGTSRLEYRQAENRSFFVALFRHLVYIGQRGCNRTALEYCKLLLSLDPDTDPLGVLLIIDFYALRSEQYRFLIRLYEEWEGHRNLSQLPNFSFSVALAYFHLNRNKNADTDKADEMIQKALIMFPSVLMALMEKCGVALASSITKHIFFTTQATISEPLALKQLVTLYVGRTNSVWKEPEVIDWLTSNVLRVLARVDTNDPLVDAASKKRRVRYQGTPRNIYRHIIMSDVADSSATLPMDLAKMPVMSYDPLPPQDSVCGYTRPERPARRTMVGDQNPVSLFLRSLLPTFNTQTPNDPLDQAQARLEEELDEAGAEGVARPLREREIARGVENLMGAMRELLNTLSFRGAPEGEGEGGNDEPNNDDEWEDGAG